MTRQITLPALAAFTFGATISLLLVTGCAGTRSAPTPAAPAAPTPAAVVLPSALDRVVAQGRVSIAPQPNEDDLRALAEQGYTHVLSVRTPNEMADRTALPFDEPTLVEALGMRYAILPQGGADFPFRAELVDGLASALAEPEARVFLHCLSGSRASLVYAAYAVKHLGMEPEAAMREAGAFGHWPLPLERMTGIELRLSRADAKAAVE